MTVTCKLRVVSKTEVADADPSKHQAGSVEVTLRPVNDETNRDWSKYTPTGEVKLSITNMDAANAFVVGGNYYAEFSRVPSESLGAKA